MSSRLIYARFNSSQVRLRLQEDSYILNPDTTLLELCSLLLRQFVLSTVSERPDGSEPDVDEFVKRVVVYSEGVLVRKGDTVVSLGLLEGDIFQIALLPKAVTYDDLLESVADERKLKESLSNLSEYENVPTASTIRLFDRSGLLTERSFPAAELESLHRASPRALFRSAMKGVVRPFVMNIIAQSTLCFATVRGLQNDLRGDLSDRTVIQWNMEVLFPRDTVTGVAFVVVTSASQDGWLEQSVRKVKRQVSDDRYSDELLSSLMGMSDMVGSEPVADKSQSDVHYHHPSASIDHLPVVEAGEILQNGVSHGSNTDERIGLDLDWSVPSPKIPQNSIFPENPHETGLESQNRMGADSSSIPRPPSVHQITEFLESNGKFSVVENLPCNILSNLENVESKSVGSVHTQSSDMSDLIQRHSPPAKQFSTECSENIIKNNHSSSANHQINSPKNEQNGQNNLDSHRDSFQNNDHLNPDNIRTSIANLSSDLDNWPSPPAASHSASPVESSPPPNALNPRAKVWSPEAEDSCTEDEEPGRITGDVEVVRRDEHFADPSRNVARLSKALQDYYKDTRPSESLLRARDHAFELLERSSLGRPKEFPDAKYDRFGSTVFELDSKESDLDVSVNVWGDGRWPSYYEAKGILVSFKPDSRLDVREHILNTRVPLIKLRYSEGEHHVDIDFSILRYEKELRKGPTIKKDIERDCRIPPFIFALKKLAKHVGVCNAYEGTMNSYTWTVLGLFLVKYRWKMQIPDHMTPAHLLREFFRLMLDFEPENQMIVYQTGTFEPRVVHDGRALLVIRGVFDAVDSTENLGRNVDYTGLQRINAFLRTTFRWFSEIDSVELPSGLQFGELMAVMSCYEV
eukprot:105428_1